MKKAFRRPSTILGMIFSGLPSAWDFSVATRRSDSTTSAGTSSRLSHLGLMAEICRATSWATWAPASSVAIMATMEGGISTDLRWA